VDELLKARAVRALTKVLDAPMSPPEREYAVEVLTPLLKQCPELLYSAVRKARHDVRAEGTGKFRPAKPHEKLTLADAWQHGGRVHPALLPKP
jgi:hypothetical protein